MSIFTYSNLCRIFLDVDILHEYKLAFILINSTLATDHQIQTRKPDLVLINKKKRTCNQGNLDFAVATDHTVKIKYKKYQYLARELKRLWKIDGFGFLV